MKYYLMYGPLTVLAICSTPESAKAWIEKFNPQMWMDKTMKKENIRIEERK